MYSIYVAMSIVGSTAGTQPNNLFLQLDNNHVFVYQTRSMSTSLISYILSFRSPVQCTEILHHDKSVLNKPCHVLVKLSNRVTL
uniref:Uncharacterized protein n=1 Tax=Hyaloperonospora arabidopsidis (strain Emoy2) TaxID=559515 RepID=M4B3A5_HYAAE